MNEAVYVGLASTTITQSYAEFQVKINLVNLMVQETLYNWSRFLRTKDDWMFTIHKQLNLVPGQNDRIDFVDETDLQAFDAEETSDDFGRINSSAKIELPGNEGKTAEPVKRKRSMPTKDLKARLEDLLR